ncbi:MAG: SLBB domain-containing protein [Magnetococcales bacterium]|nr:SLBB domain-containing protein [Magnetococcales bacterium]
MVSGRQWIIPVLVAGLLLPAGVALGADTGRGLGGAAELLRQLGSPEVTRALERGGDSVDDDEGAVTDDKGSQPRPRPVTVSPLNRVHPSRLDDPGPMPDRFMPVTKGGKEGSGGAPEATAQQPAQPLTPLGGLRQFGYDLFAGSPSTFAPVGNVPVPDDYRLGPGDGFLVQLTGKEFRSVSLQVNREGMVNFPDIGRIPVNGVSFGELKSLLDERVKSQLIGLEIAHITMGKLRSIRVFILGEAFRPGSYTVSALSTMTNALFVSGGVNPLGSLRNIQLKRGSTVVTTLDLYDLLMNGDTRADRRLEAGDVIFVPAIGETAGVEGEVRRPGIFELKGERTVKDLLQLAGGFLPTAFEDGLQLERIRGRKDRTLISLNLTQADLARTQIMNGDTLRVPSVFKDVEGVVTLSGHVARAGQYQWRSGMRLTDVIGDVNVLQDNPDLAYVLIKREQQRGFKTIVLSTRLDQALDDPTATANIPLQSRDQILAFGLNEDRAKTLEPWIRQLRRQSSSDMLEPVVEIAGNVRFPGTYPHTPGMLMTDLLRAAAETLPGTDLDYALVTRVLDKDGRVGPFSVRLREIIGNAGSPSDIPLQQEDKVLIFSSSQYFEENERFQAYRGLFFRNLTTPGQGEALDRIGEKGATRSDGEGFAPPDPLQTEDYFFPRLNPNKDSTTAETGPEGTAAGEEDQFGNQDNRFFRSFAGNPMDASMGNTNTQGRAAGDRVRSRTNPFVRSGSREGDPRDAQSERDLRTGTGNPRSEQEFTRFNQRQRFKAFRQDVEELPEFLTGRISKEDAKRFGYLRVPKNSPELAEYYYLWSRRTREGLLKPVLDQLLAQATLTQPSRIISISGMVRFPGQYPLENGMHLSDLIRAGGWLAEPAYTLEAEITRFSVVDNKSREIDHIKVVLSDVLAGHPGSDLTLQPFDSLTIKPVPNWAETTLVAVKGEVKFPGVYPVKKGETLVQLIDRAGGLTKHAYPEAAVFLRKSLQERERKEMNFFASRLEMELAKAAIVRPSTGDRTNRQVDSSFLSMLVKKLKETEAQGRLAIDLPVILAARKSDESAVADALYGDPSLESRDTIFLRDGDQLLIPQRSNEITVLGEVNYPTSHQFKEGMTPEDYVSLSGGFSNNADRGAIYVVKANGQVRPKASSSPFGSAWFYMGHLDLAPGDAIVVPIETERFEFMAFVKEVSTVLYNLAITLAAVNSVGALGSDN